MDIEVRSGCTSIESGFFMDVEVRIECSADPSARRVGPQVLQGHPRVAKGASGRSSARIPCPQVLQRHPGVAKRSSDRSSARPPCPQLPQGHPGVAKSHLTKDKPVSARCKDQLSYRRAYRQTCRMVSYACLTDRQTGPPYRQPYLKLSPAGSHGSSLPPTLPTGFVSQTFRPPDRQTFPNARPTSLTGSLTGRFRSSGQTGQPHRQPDRQPHRPATPASPTDQPDQQPHRPSTPAINTGHPHPPSSPAKVPPASLTGRLRSAGRRLRGWRSSRHG